MGHVVSTSPDASEPRVRLIVFGFVLTLLSGFGQTFFIGLFGTELRGATGLSDAAFGTTYSVATLLSAALMVWVGGLLDRMALTIYVLVSAGLVALGYALLTVTAGLASLGVALFLLRFGGQGMLAHTAITSVARFGGRRRGRALSLALLGHPAGEAAFPPAAVAIATALGWRALWLGAAALLVVTALWLARIGSTLAAPKPSAREADGPAPAAPVSAAVAITRRDLLRDRRFHLLVPALLVPAFVLTGVFFHQTRLVAEKGWPLTWFASMFIVFAAAQTLAMLTVGPLIDRLQARRLVPLYLLPLALACVVINLGDSRFLAIPFMIGSGVTMGCSTAIVTSLWVETYGAEHIGAIRALGSSIGVVGAALAPALFGWAIERGVSLDAVLIACAAVGVTAALLALMATRAPEPAPR